MIKKFILLFNSHKKIAENYFFMTIIQILNSLFSIVIYPYLIRALGADSYGLYVYVLSIITYFNFLINFGFDFPATKAVAEFKDDKDRLNEILSCVFTAKFYLQVISFGLMFLLIWLVPFFRNNYLIFILVFLQTISNVLFPQWYYQGVQRMRVVTLIQVIFKVLSIPLIFTFVKSASDVNIFAGINSITIILGAIVAAIMIVFYDGIKIRIVGFVSLKKWFSDAFPFFLSSSVGIIKEQGVPILIGSFFGMRDVALYDLANKIVIIPRTLLMSLNAALFPKIVTLNKKDVVRKIIKYEYLIGIFTVIFVIIFGKWIIQFLGGDQMAGSYYLSIILSMSIISWLVVGAYISFVFIPSNNYYLVTKNQILASVSAAFFIIIGMVINHSIYVLVSALAFSGLLEIAFCSYVTSKKRLL
ncbi:MAG: flippase [Chryseobacterium sp.]|nr:MAG: flippase [Chryseobacterium sp.]